MEKIEDYSRENFYVYAIYDKVAEEWANPMIAKNDGMMKRLIIDRLAQLPNAEDFELYRIGLYSLTTGKLAHIKHKKVHFGMIKNIEISENKVDNPNSEDLE